MIQAAYWTDLKVGENFRIIGFDDLLKKISDTHAKDLGCGWSRKPRRFARKGEKILIATIDSNCSGLIKA